MEYQGIRYTMLVGIEREGWSVVIHPPNCKPITRSFKGSREKAKLTARSMIENWRKTHQQKSSD